MKIGIIQTRGIGDIVIAIPLAAYFIGQGHEVYWPIDNRFLAAFQYARPDINFIPIDSKVEDSQPLSYFLYHPRQILAGL